jgi:hypothetical protein
MCRATPSGRIASKLGTFIDLANFINCTMLHVDRLRGSNFTGIEICMFYGKANSSSTLHLLPCMKTIYGLGLFFLIDGLNDAERRKEVPFVGLIDKNFVQGDFPFPKNFNGLFLRGKSNQLENVE